MLERFGYLGSDQIELLKEVYTLLRLIENGLLLIYDDSNNLLDFGQIDQNSILKLINCQGYHVSDLYQTVDQATLSIREIYQSVMNQRS